MAKKKKVNAKLKKVKSKAKKTKKKKKTKKSSSRKSRETKKGYKVVQKPEMALLGIPADNEEETKEPKDSAEERYIEEFRQYIDEDEIEEEDIGESDKEETWGEDE